MSVPSILLPTPAFIPLRTLPSEILTPHLPSPSFPSSHLLFSPRPRPRRALPPTPVINRQPRRLDINRRPAGSTHMRAVGGMTTDWVQCGGFGFGLPGMDYETRRDETRAGWLGEGMKGNDGRVGIWACTDDACAQTRHGQSAVCRPQDVHGAHSGNDDALRRVNQTDRTHARRRRTQLARVLWPSTSHRDCSNSSQTTLPSIRRPLPLSACITSPHSHRRLDSMACKQIHSRTLTAFPILCAPLHQSSVGSRSLRGNEARGVACVWCGV